jgi:hypothetical protein
MTGVLQWLSDALSGRLLDLADPLVVKRRGECLKCEHAFQMPWGRHCKQCGCLLKAKTRTASEACPLGRW